MSNEYVWHLDNMVKELKQLMLLKFEQLEARLAKLEEGLTQEKYDTTEAFGHVGDQVEEIEARLDELEGKPEVNDTCDLIAELQKNPNPLRPQALDNRGSWVPSSLLQQAAEWKAEWKDEIKTAEQAEKVLKNLYPVHVTEVGFPEVVDFKLNEMWLRRMADAEDGVNGCISVGGLAADTGQPLPTDSTPANPLPSVSPCRKCGHLPMVFYTSPADADPACLTVEISCCGETAIGGLRDETVACWNRRNAQPTTDQPAKRREWWAAIGDSGIALGIFDSRDEALTEYEQKHVIRVIAAPSEAEIEAAANGWYSDWSKAEIKAAIRKLMGGGE